MGRTPVYDQEKLYDIIEVLIRIAEGRESQPLSGARLADRPTGGASVIIGARTDAQLQDNLGGGCRPYD